MTEEVKQVETKVEEKVEEKAVETKQPDYTPQEQTAISFGWMPKEDWVKAGHEADDWVPAKHFMKYGELKNQLVTKDKQVTKQDKIIKMMKDHHLRVKETAYQDAMKAIKAERQRALDENDIAAAEKLRDRMDELKDEHAKAKALPVEVERELQENVQEQQPPAIHPEFHSWHSKNTWYIPDPKKQDDMSKMADRLGKAIVLEAQQAGRDITVKEIYKEVETEIKKLYPSKFSTPKSPQEDSSGTTGKGESKSRVKLSEEELKVAAAFGLTPEKYAEQQKSYKGR